MSIAPVPRPAPGQPAAANCPPAPANAPAAAPRPGGEAELAVVAVLGYN